METGQPNIPQARSRLHQTAQPVEPDFDDTGDTKAIQKGMPARTLKQGLLVLVALVMLAFQFWPKSEAPVAKEPPPVQITAPTGDLVKELENAKPEPPPIQEEVATAPPAPPMNPPGVATEPPAPSLEDERELAALLASTDSSDVTITRNRTATSSPASDLGSLIASQQAKADQLMQESQAFAQRMMQQSQADAAAAASAANAGAQPTSTYARFINQQAGSGTLGSAIQLEAARSPYTLYEGTILRTVLTRSLKTDLPGVVTAKVTTDLYDTVTQRTLLIPRGSEITCAYQSELMAGQELVLAACNRLRLPNGKSFSLAAATASDMQGASGLPAEVNNHFWKMFKTALIVGAASKLLPSADQQVSVNEGTSGVSTGGSILGIALNRIIEATLARNILIPPTGTVDIGTPFTLTLSRDVELEPYLR